MVRSVLAVYNVCREKKRSHALSYGGTKMIRISTRCLIGVLALLLGNANMALGQAKKSDGVVKVEAAADKPDADGKQTITITLDIDKTWHVYANPVDNEDLTPAQTVVSIASKGKLDDVKIEYPAGKEQTDAGVKYKIYEGKVVIKARVKRASGNNDPLELTIKLQACNDKTCLVPATIKKELPSVK